MEFDSIFIIGATQALFLAFIFIYKKAKNSRDILLIIWLLFLAFHLLFIYFGFSGFYKKNPKLIVIGSSLMLLEGPLLYIYTLLATNKIKKLRLKHTLHSIPFLLFTVYFAHKVYNLRRTDLYEAISSLFNDNNNIMVMAFGILNHFHLIIYLALSIILLRNYTKQLSNNYSFTEGINLRWLKNLIFGITAIAVLIVVGLIFSDIFPLITHYVKGSFIFSAFALLPFYMSFYVLTQKLTYAESDVNLESTKYESSGLSKEASRKIALQLSEYMELEKPFLDSKLSIKELSGVLKLHTKQLSQVINENFEQNFFNYINNHRVEEFKRRLVDSENDNFTLIAVAYDCGFNTKSSFNSIFKKVTGMTPSTYKSSL